jgi:AcrR family transcriptional regulator
MSRIVKDPAQRRAEIIDTARTLFLTKGYEKATMQDVMHTLGIAKGTVYHYFDSKEKLLEAVVSNMIESRMAEIKDQLQKFDGTALEKIQLLTQLGNLAKEHPELLDPLNHPTNAALHLRMLVESLGKFTPICAKLIQQGCEEGIFQTTYPLECAEFILSAIQFLTDTGIHPWTMEELERRAKAFPQLIERQLSAPPGSFQFLSKGFLN